MTNNFTNVIATKSTDELMDIYINKFLDYQEEFLQEVYKELTQTRGISEMEMEAAINKESVYLKDNYMDMTHSLYRQGRTSNEIMRFFQRYGLSSVNIDEIRESIDEVNKEKKRSEYTSKMTIGAFLFIACFVIRWAGYDVLYHKVPVTWLLILGGAILVGIGFIGYIKNDCF